MRPSATIDACDEILSALWYLAAEEGEDDVIQLPAATPPRSTWLVVVRRRPVPTITTALEEASPPPPVPVAARPLRMPPRAPRPRIYESACSRPGIELARAVDVRRGGPGNDTGRLLGGTPAISPSTTSRS